MFIGHYAVALAAKSAAPRTSLGTLFFSAQGMGKGRTTRVWVR